MRIKNLLLVVVAILTSLVIGVGIANAQPPPREKPVPLGAVQLPSLPTERHYGRQVVSTPEGNVTIEWGDASTKSEAGFKHTRGVNTTEAVGNDSTISVGSEAQVDGATAAAATTYYRSCWVAATSSLYQWQIKLSSTFQYNYTTLWQQVPRISVWNVLPYSWSDLKAWNNPWTSTVKFADGQGVLHVGVWKLGAAVTYNLSIQEDAWGNCTPKVWRS